MADVSTLGRTAEAVDDTEPDVPPPPTPRRPRWRRPQWTLRRATVAAVVASVLLVVAAHGWWQARNDVDALTHEAQLRTSAAKAAQKYAVDLTTYDYASLDAQQQTLEAESTARFQKTFATSMESLAPIFEKLQATAKGTVTDAAVTSVSDDAAKVILFVDQEASSTRTAKPETQPSRLRVTLVRRGDRWLLDRVDLV